MQKAVRNAGVVLNWMNGTRSLIQNDDPRFKAAATQAFGQEWNTLKPTLLNQLDSSARIAQIQANRTIDTQGDLSAHAYVPSDKVGAVFQSAMEEHLNDRLTSTVQAQSAGVQPPYGPPEKFDSGDAGWVVVVVARLKEALEGKATFIHHSNLTNFRFDLPDQTKVALFADWATGEPPALAIKVAIESRAPEYKIHLGDTYYAGFADEIRHNLIACWPGGIQYGKSFAMNGNHEMYCGGKPYFNLLPTFGQAASYFNLGNSHWRLIALDTSFAERGGDTPASSWGDLEDKELKDPQLEWLAAQVQHAKSFNPPAKIVLLTHHQLFSAFDGDTLGQYLKSQLKAHLDNGDFFAWFWGHEHRGIVYGPNSTYSFKARCIGHGSFPYPPSTDMPAHNVQFPITWRETRPEPANAWYGMRGFAVLTFTGNAVNIDYVDQQGGTAYSENW